jgi:hypothetical protein
VRYQTEFGNERGKAAAADSSLVTGHWSLVTGHMSLATP